MKYKNRKERRLERQKEAIERQEIRNSRTPEQQLCLVATRRGNSKRETNRLLEQMKKEK